ncbi:MAG: hypothetical protein HY259_06910 [Chloroflexi bacterium]|nr:hypothetical protein [Chloroflexota bacterium]MBI3733174.1 hypothetical protein [Chloroflexota bacterium]
MPKPTRRERRKLAETGKPAPRRPAVMMPSATPRKSAEEPAPEPRAPTTVSGQAPRATPMMTAVASHEYDHVTSDLRRIFLLAATLVGAMIALKFTLPQ